MKFDLKAFVQDIAIDEIDSKYPNNEIKETIKAEIFYQRQAYDKVIACYEETIRINPNNYQIYINMALIYKDQKKAYDKALEYYEKSYKVVEQFKNAGKEQILQAISNQIEGLKVCQKGYNNEHAIY